MHDLSARSVGPEQLNLVVHAEWRLEHSKRFLRNIRSNFRLSISCQRKALLSSISPMSLDDLIPTLQLAIGPVILISGVGLIMLSMTNRFGRIIDRSRFLAHDLQVSSESDHARVLAQLRILSTRARVLRAAIALGAVSVLLAAILIISLFLGTLLQLGIVGIIVTLFILCMVSLIASLLLFISDINLSLRALWLEMPQRGAS